MNPTVFHDLLKKIKNDDYLNLYRSNINLKSQFNSKENLDFLNQSIEIPVDNFEDWFEQQIKTHYSILCLKNQPKNDCLLKAAQDRDQIGYQFMFKFEDEYTFEDKLDAIVINQDLKKMAEIYKTQTVDKFLAKHGQPLSIYLANRAGLFNKNNLFQYMIARGFTSLFGIIYSVELKANQKLNSGFLDLIFKAGISNFTDIGTLAAYYIKYADIENLLNINRYQANFLQFQNPADFSNLIWAAIKFQNKDILQLLLNIVDPNYIRNNIYNQIEITDITDIIIDLDDTDYFNLLLQNGLDLSDPMIRKIKNILEKGKSNIFSVLLNYNRQSYNLKQQLKSLDLTSDPNIMLEILNLQAGNIDFIFDNIEKINQLIKEQYKPNNLNYIYIVNRFFEFKNQDILDIIESDVNDSREPIAVYLMQLLFGLINSKMNPNYEEIFSYLVDFFESMNVDQSQTYYELLTGARYRAGLDRTGLDPKFADLYRNYIGYLLIIIEKKGTWAKNRYIKDAAIFGDPYRSYIFEKYLKNNVEINPTLFWTENQTPIPGFVHLVDFPKYRNLPSNVLSALLALIIDLGDNQRKDKMLSQVKEKIDLTPFITIYNMSRSRDYINTGLFDKNAFSTSFYANIIVDRKNYDFDKIFDNDFDPNIINYDIIVSRHEYYGSDTSRYIVKLLSAPFIDANRLLRPVFQIIEPKPELINQLTEKICAKKLNIKINGETTLHLLKWLKKKNFQKYLLTLFNSCIVFDFDLAIYDAIDNSNIKMLMSLVDFVDRIDDITKYVGEIIRQDNAPMLETLLYQNKADKYYTFDGVEEIIRSGQILDILIGRIEHFSTFDYILPVLAQFGKYDYLLNLIGRDKITNYQPLLDVLVQQLKNKKSNVKVINRLIDRIEKVLIQSYV